MMQLDWRIDITASRVIGQSVFTDKEKRVLILSLFPGADLYGRGFEEEGFCVVKGPDILMGGDVRDFKGIEGKFDGIIGGPPCQSFSNAIASQPGGASDATHPNLIPEFERIVAECRPQFYIMENVPQAPKPDINVIGQFCVWDKVVDAHEYGAAQHRTRRFSSNIDLESALAKQHLSKELRHPDPWPCITATEYKASAGSSQRAMRQRAGRKVGRRMTIEEMNTGMGLPKDFDTPALLKSQQYVVRGNGVPVQMAAALARAVKAYYAS
jgi:DNA (cytosine-5)-methyltransferase 1